jgi:lipopolysaccharide export system protein LptC
MNDLPHESVLDTIQRHSPEELKALTRRRPYVVLLKRLLPVAGAVLLVALALAPSWKSGPDSNRVAYHVQVGSGTAPASRLLGASYHGTDQQGQPFTITADTAEEKDSDHVVLVAPVGDITLKSGAWLMLKSANGMYHQKSDTLNLTGNVTLYRNDGTTMTTSAADIDLHAGNASSTSPVQVQGPFGTLNAANGFTLTGRGTQVTFNGPAQLTLIQAR